ncbi:MAG: SpoIIE family protein phosphatase [Thermoflexales bacterium]|nr:SpoIIE family protein phosphatase [Thermoflexales bacterium]
MGAVSLVFGPPATAFIIIISVMAGTINRRPERHQPDPAAVLRAVNRAIYADTRGKTFVTLCYAVLDLQRV